MVTAELPRNSLIHEKISPVWPRRIARYLFRHIVLFDPRTVRLREVEPVNHSSVA